ncbi:HutD family protein [Cryobacterium sp. PH31-AA6]|uniref:HutD/Ves family protein n=1 Tax=Cryobacterium sp. PH31-AA6 TaxID=3046205 RepID=UPI0024B9FA7E|nr:HutD family protein [Cryobacterium sp. PH31-AA6]MDJ0323673.1 HutD family protein [Cryobacterium sp. PH31-AA6]
MSESGRMPEAGRMSQVGPLPESNRLPEAGWARLPAVDRVPAPWRNGGGTTVDVIVRGAGRTVGARPGSVAGSRVGSRVDFDWRISIATVERDGDFSRYPGVDRWLMPLSAGGLTLVNDGALVPVAQHEVHAFPGERAVAAVGVSEPTLDLNLMLRRGRSVGSLRTIDAVGRLALTNAAEEELVAVVLDGDFDTDSNAVRDAAPDGPRVARSLARHDAVFLGAGGEVTLYGAGRIAVARIAQLPT